MSTAATRGHAANAPGLRGHSIGPLYPWSVIGLGHDWGAFNCLTGETVRCATYDVARDVCESALAAEQGVAV